MYAARYRENHREKTVEAIIAHQRFDKETKRPETAN
jgi:hypothetical protein